MKRAASGSRKYADNIFEAVLIKILASAPEENLSVAYCM